MTYPLNGIATDAAHSTKQGKTLFRGIDLKTRKELFSVDLGNQTVNIGEFLGIVTAAKYIIEHNFTPPKIYTDSINAITWFKNKKTGSKKKNIQLEQAEIFLKVMTVEIDQIELIHWKTPIWGEIPADYGNK